MTKNLLKSAPRAAGVALALSLGFPLAGCGGMANNRSLESLHQPVVQRSLYTLDLTTGPGGLSGSEQQRLCCAGVSDPKFHHGGAATTHAGAGGGAAFFSLFICLTIKKMINAKMAKLSTIVMKLP